MADFQTLIKQRQSIRKYQNRPLQRADIIACVEAASLAPSACNVQPWKFIVIDELKLKEKLCEKAFTRVPNFNHFVKQAPVIVVVLADRDLITNRLVATLKGIPYYLLDIGAACEQFILQAAELNIGTCWIGWFKEKPIKKLLSIPPGQKVVSLITLGYPAEDTKEPQEKNRKNIDQIISFNMY